MQQWREKSCSSYGVGLGLSICRPKVLFAGTVAKSGKKWSKLASGKMWSRVNIAPEFDDIWHNYN